MTFWHFIHRLAVLLIAAVLVSGAVMAFYPKIRQHRELQRREQRLQDEIRFEEEMLQLLKSKQEQLQNDPRFLERIAREELGLAKPGETVFKFIDDPSSNAAARP